MKKLIFMLVFGFVAFFVNAQSVTIPPLNVDYTQRIVSTSYALSGTTVRTFTCAAVQRYPTTQDLIIELDSVSGGNSNVTVALYGKKSTVSTGAAIGSAVIWHMTTPDTLITISNASANRYQIFYWTITRAGAGVNAITYQQLKLYLE